MLFLLVILTFNVNALIQEISFNGTFQNGTSLFSDPIFIETGFFYGRDVFPVRERICENVTEIKQSRVCHQTSMITKKFSCETTEVEVTREKCRNAPAENRTPIACEDPFTHAVSNVLRLRNFNYSNDSGITWNPVPYIKNRIEVQNDTLFFRVNIPNLCSPAYHIEKAISIKT